MNIISSKIIEARKKHNHSRILEHLISLGYDDIKDDLDMIQVIENNDIDISDFKLPASSMDEWKQKAEKNRPVWTIIDPNEETWFYNGVK